MSEIEKMDLESANLVDERLERMRELFPEVFSESGIDFEKLRLELGDEVDDSDERYAFTWPGKRNAIRQSQTVSTATLRPCIEKSRGRDGKDGSFDSDNVFIEGDNLEVLKLMQRGYHGKIKMIYIDPPYNTGADFVYRDSFEEPLANYLSQINANHQSNADSSGRYHSNWCSMMYPRLKLARELLSAEGCIFISIDDNELPSLRRICDEIFGDNNFVCTFAWQKRYSAPPDTKDVGYMHENIVMYKRSSRFKMGLLPFSDEQLARYKNPDNDPRGPWKAADYTARYTADERPSLYYPVRNPNTGEEIWPKRSRVWAFSRDTHEKNVEENRIWWGADGRNGTPALKNFLCEIKQGRMPSSLLLHTEVGHTDEAAKELRELLPNIKFTPKPTRLIAHLLRIANIQHSDIVLDFFAGSGTTAHSVMKRNLEDRLDARYILVQLPEPADSKSGFEELGLRDIAEMGEMRIRRAGEKIKSKLEESNVQLKLGEESKQLPDIGFRVFKLDESGIQKPEPGQLLVDCVKPDRSELDIVFEMMLKWGLELTLPVEREELAGYPCYTVAYGELVCCLARGLTIDALEAIAEIEPRRVFILDSILDDSLKLNAVQIFKRVEERTGREVELRTV